MNQGVGTRFALSSKLLGRRIDTLYETLEYEPNTSATWTTVSGPISLTFRRTFDSIEGGTRDVVSYTGELKGPVKLLRRLIVASGRRTNARAMRTLKQLLESSDS